MKKKNSQKNFQKKLTSGALILSLAVSGTAVSGIHIPYATTTVQAAANTLTNESVVYPYVSDEEAFRDYIDNDGAYASQDTITTAWKGYSEVHKIVLDEPGTLLICPLAPDNGINFQLYNNFALTSLVKTDRTRPSNRDGISGYKLDAGTYYYRGERWNGYDPITFTTYLGFIPDSGNLKTDTSFTSTTVRDASEVTYTTVSKPEDLNTYINNDGAFASQDTITTNWTGQSDLHKFTVAENGWLFIHPLCENNNIDWKLYSNIDLTSCLLTTRTRSNSSQGISAIYLKAGTYYYRGERWNGYDPITFTTYLGFMPSASRISVNNITLSDDKTYANVTFDYNAEYLNGFTSGTIRMINGSVQTRHIQDEKVWESDTKKNALESATVKITENGTYTARIEGLSDKYYCMVTFEVTGIEKKAPTTKPSTTKPAAPKIKTAKKNQKVIKGTSKAKAKVYVKVYGKTYKATANNKGTWSVKISKKLKSKTKITAYVKNADGLKSKTSTYTVK